MDQVWGRLGSLAHTQSCLPLPPLFSTVSRYPGPCAASWTPTQAWLLPSVHGCVWGFAHRCREGPSGVLNPAASWLMPGTK